VVFVPLWVHLPDVFQSRQRFPFHLPLPFRVVCHYLNHIIPRTPCQILQAVGARA
jgi:hypothetical protein